MIQKGTRYRLRMGPAAPEVTVVDVSGKTVAYESHDGARHELSRGDFLQVFARSE